VSLARDSGRWHVGVVLANGRSYSGEATELEDAIGQVIFKTQGARVLLVELNEAQDAVVRLMSVRAEYPEARVLLHSETEHGQLWLVQRDGQSLPLHVEVPNSRLDGEAGEYSPLAARRFRGLRVVLDQAFPSKVRVLN